MKTQMQAYSWMHKHMYNNLQTSFPVVCSRLEEINKDELTKEDSAKLEEIFHLLVDCTKVSTTNMNLSPLQSPTSIQPADRFVTESVLIKSPNQQAYHCCSLSAS